MDILRFELIKIGFLGVSVIDILDIALVAFVFYKLYQVMRGTRGSQMFAGLGVILAASFIVQGLNMSGMSWIISNIRTVWVIAFVILFQPELRRLLIVAGQSRLVRTFIPMEQAPFIEPIVKASVECSQRRYGALLVLVRDTGLKAIIESGEPVQAKVSDALIVSIFSPRSPLHDGALIINQDSIVSAKCLLPLTQNPNFPKRLGTRHRAGIGITEESDAVVIIVSEETGKISVSYNGKMVEDMDYDGLYSYLLSAFKEHIEKD
ncbi:MAG: TIGR00159 family protein [bacterium]|nr:TIGR00159 family protein [bacterium]